MDTRGNGAQRVGAICSRAARWRLQLRALGIRPSSHGALLLDIRHTYALNLIFPRLGEVWRCTYIADRERKPFTTVVGSMVADRFADMLVVLALTLLCFVVAAPAIEAFSLVKYPVGKGPGGGGTQSLGVDSACRRVAVIWALFRFGRSNRFPRPAPGNGLPRCGADSRW